MLHTAAEGETATESNKRGGEGAGEGDTGGGEGGYFFIPLCSYRHHPLRRTDKIICRCFGAPALPGFP